MLIQLGRGDEKNINNKEEVAKKRTTVNERLAEGDRIHTLDATQGIGNRRPIRSSAKKAVGWYIEEEQESHSHHFLYYLVGTPVLKIRFGPPNADFRSVWSSQKARKFRQIQPTTKLRILCFDCPLRIKINDSCFSLCFQ